MEHILTYGAVENKAVFCLHVIGDSHSLAFDEKFFHFGKTKTDFFCKVNYLPGLCVENLLRENNLHNGIVNYFFQQQFIEQNGNPGALSEDLQLINRQYARGSGFCIPQILFCCGCITVRGWLKREVNALERISEDEVLTAQINEKMTIFVKHYVNVLNQISHKFRFNIAVNQLTPPTADDEKYASINEHGVSAKIRALAYRLFNERLLEHGRASGLIVCETYSELADNDGLLAKDFEFDGVHAHPKAAGIAIGSYASHKLNERESEQSLRYRPWFKSVYNLENAGPQAKQLVLERIALSSLRVSEPFQLLTEQEASDLTDDISEFQPPFSTSPKNDWASLPFESKESTNHNFIKQAVLRKIGCKSLHEKLYAPAVHEKLKSLFGADFSVVQVRPTKSLVPPKGTRLNGSPYLRSDKSPPGIFRGVLYLSDVESGDGAFEFTNSSNTEEHFKINGGKGVFFVFDPNRIQPCGASPKNNEVLFIDFIFLIQPKENRNLVHSGDIGDVWPVDPYLFSISERNSIGPESFIFTRPT